MLKDLQEALEIRFHWTDKRKIFCIVFFFILTYFLIFCSLAHNLYQLNQLSILDVNEAWNQFKVGRLLKGEALYPPVPEGGDGYQRYLMTNNYPPLSFYLIAGLHSLPILSKLSILTLGRVVSAFSIAAVVCFIGISSQKTTIFLETDKKYRPAFCAITLFLIFNAGIINHYFAMYDPQWTSEILVLGGLAVFLSYSALPLGIISASFLLVCAGFFKHNLIAAPLAVTLWLLFFQRKSLLIWFVSGFVFVLTGLSLCFLLFGEQFFKEVIGFEFGRKHSFTYLYGHNAELLFVLCSFFLLECMVFFFSKRCFGKSKNILFWLLFTALGIVVGAFGGASNQCDINVFFDAVIGVCILGGSACLCLSSFMLKKNVSLHSRALPLLLSAGSLIFLILKIVKKGFLI